MSLMLPMSLRKRNKLKIKFQNRISQKEIVNRFLNRQSKIKKSYLEIKKIFDLEKQKRKINNKMYYNKNLNKYLFSQ